MQCKRDLCWNKRDNQKRKLIRIASNGWCNLIEFTFEREKRNTEELETSDAKALINEFTENLILC